MEPEQGIAQELEALGSPLSHFPRTMPFYLPNGYFSGFPSVMMEHVRLFDAEDPLLTLPKAMPFFVPAGYLDDFPALMLQQATRSSSEAKTDTAYGVPDGYFDQLPAQILAAAKAAGMPEQKTKVIALLPFGKALRWAAAAMLVLGLGLGSYHYYHTRTPEAAAAHQLAAVDKAALNEYACQNIEDFDAELPEHHITSNKYPLKDLDQLKDEEIINYLDETGWEDKTIN